MSAERSSPGRVHARDGGPVHVGGRVARRGSFASCRWSPHMHEEQVTDAGYAYNAHPDLTTICRSFPKISSALSTKFCGGSRSDGRVKRCSFRGAGGGLASSAFCKLNHCGQVG